MKFLFLLLLTSCATQEHIIETSCYDQCMRQGLYVSYSSEECKCVKLNNYAITQVQCVANQ